MSDESGEVAVIRGSHADVVESPGLEGRIEIFAESSEPTVRVPQHVGIEYGDDELETDGGAIADESRIIQKGWSPTAEQSFWAMVGGAALILFGGVAFGGSGAEREMLGLVTATGGAGLLYGGHKATVGGAA